MSASDRYATFEEYLSAVHEVEQAAAALNTGGGEKANKRLIIALATLDRAHTAYKEALTAMVNRAERSEHSEEFAPNWSR